MNTKLKLETFKIEPSQIRKHKTMNPFVEYKDSKTGKPFATKGMGVWHDKIFFDSLITRSYEKIHGTKSISEKV